MAENVTAKEILSAANDQKLVLDAASKVSAIAQQLSCLKKKHERYSRAIENTSTIVSYLSQITELLNVLVHTHFYLRFSIRVKILRMLGIKSSKYNLYVENMALYNSVVNEFQTKLPHFHLQPLHTDFCFPPGYIGYLYHQSELAHKRKDEILPLLTKNLSSVKITIAQQEDELKLAKGGFEELKRQIFKRGLAFADELAVCTRNMTPQQKNDFDYILEKHKEKMSSCVDITQVVTSINDLLQESKEQLEKTVTDITILDKGLEIIQKLSRAAEVIRKIEREGRD